MPFIRLTPQSTARRDLRVWIDPLTGAGIEAIWEETSAFPANYFTKVGIGSLVVSVQESLDEVEALVRKATIDLTPPDFRDVEIGVKRDNPEAYGK